MSQIALNPAASPVDIFAPAEVRGPGNKGADLAALGQSLAGFNAALSNFAPIYQQRRREDALRENREAVKKYNIKNREELRNAVDQGLIPKTDDPWYLVDIRRDFAASAAREAAFGFQAWYDSDDPEAVQTRKSDSPEVVRAAIQQKLNGLYQEADAWEVEAMQPILDGFTDQMIGEHLRRRRGDREVERKDAFTLSLASQMTQALNDVEAVAGPPEDPKAALADLADTIAATVADGEQTLGGEDAGRYAVQAAIQVQAARGEAGVAAALLQKATVTGPDGQKIPLSAAYAAQIAEADRATEQLARQRLVWARQDEQAAREQQTQDFLNKYGRDANGRVDARLLLSNAPLEQLGVEEQAAVIRMASQLQNTVDAERFNASASELLPKVAKGEISGLEAMILLAPLDYDRAVNMFYLARNMREQQTDMPYYSTREGALEAQKIRRDDSLNQWQKAERLMELGSSGVLSMQDFSRSLEDIFDAATRAARSSGSAMPRSAAVSQFDAVTDRLRSDLLRQEGLGEVSLEGKWQFIDPAVDAEVDDAIAKVTFEFQRDIDFLENPTARDVYDLIERHRQRLAEAFNLTPEAVERAKAENKAAATLSDPTASMARLPPVSTSKGQVLLDGKPIGTPLWKTADHMLETLDVTAERLGIDPKDPKAVGELVSQQIKLLPPAEQPKAAANMVLRLTQLQMTENQRDWHTAFANSQYLHNIVAKEETELARMLEYKQSNPLFIPPPHIPPGIFAKLAAAWDTRVAGAKDSAESPRIDQYTGRANDPYFTYGRLSDLVIQRQQERVRLARELRDEIVTGKLPMPDVPFTGAGGTLIRRPEEEFLAGLWEMKLARIGKPEQPGNGQPGVTTE